MSTNTSYRKILPVTRVKTGVFVPGDKSISHRVALLGSLSGSISKVRNFSPGKDCLSTVLCLEALGVEFERIQADTEVLSVHGAGRYGFNEPVNTLNAGNSGTTMRLLSGILAAQSFNSAIDGDDSLRSRPMKRLIEPLRLMGADIHGRNNDSMAPLDIRGTKLHGIDYVMPVASAQIKSAILLAALFAETKTTVTEQYPSRDHTERLLEIMGAHIKRYGTSVTLHPSDVNLLPINITVPGDISAAAYWMVLGAIHPDARIEIHNCGINPTRTGIIDVLKDMGAKIDIYNYRIEGNEPFADISIESSDLKRAEISGEVVPRVIDEIPVIAVAACMAKGPTIIRGAEELRVKESDRISTMVFELTRMGAQIEELPDGMIIKGGTSLKGAEVDSHLDHRLALSLAIAGLVAKGKTIIYNTQAADISYPGFWSQLEKLSHSL
jgi:3-phosphoshikimate 1-carboxyvinyltransferase